MKKLFFLTLLLCVFSRVSFSQLDTAFWFAVPFATPDHNPDKMAALRITMNNYGDSVFIEQPLAPAAFPVKKVWVAAHATVTVSLNSYMFQTAPPASAAGANTANTIDIYPLGGTISPNATSTAWDNNNPKSNKALHIYSLHHNKFNVYYEYDPNNNSALGGTNNPDIWVLKGKNALGYDFYVPFQTTWTNQNFKYWPAYSAFDIVATKNNTNVTITLPTGKAAAGAGHNTPGMTFTITLNRGQTYSVAPVQVTENNSGGTSWKVPSRLPANRLAGTYVHADQPIAVTTKDDSNVKSTAYDMIGDQIIPLRNISNQNVVGHKYIVMRGQVTNLSATQGEAIYICTTAKTDSIMVSNKNGKDSTIAKNLVAGQQVTYVIPGSKTSFTVRGTQPVYVFHVSGFVHELGGALLPSVDGCTGSLDVSFVRSIGGTTANCNSTSDNNIFLNIMTKKSAIDSFYWQIGNGTPQKFGNASYFKPVGDSSWYVLKDNYKCFSTQIPQGTTVRFWNTEDVFHLGMINGVSSGGGCRYGYFSNYNEIESSVYTVESQTNLYTNCELDTVQLQAEGGLMNRYLWFPTDYLIDPPNIANPRAVVPRGWTDFYCKIKQPCMGYDTLRVTVFSPLNPFAFFTVDQSKTCYPDTVINITNASENATKYRWTFGDGSGIKYYSNKQIQYSYSNRTNTPKVFDIYLETENSDGCLSNFKVPITVNPYLKAGFTASDSVVCHPLDTVHYKQPIVFTNTSKGNVTDTSYIWNFADGNSTDTKNPRHIFTNLFGIKDTIYKVRMVATSPYYCTDTAWKNITVHPFIKANFTVDSVKGCSPVMVTLHNQSKGAISFYNWNFGDGTIRTVSQDTLIHAYPRNLGAAPISYKILLTVSHKFGNGCPDTISRLVTVYPEGKVNILNPDTVSCNTARVKFRVKTDAGVSQYNWDFGDGNTDFTATPFHEFVNNTGGDVTYLVKLRTASAQYCGGFDTMKVTVHANLDPEFAIDAPGSCSPHNATIINKSLGGITTYNWDFGDGTAPSTTNAASFTHLFQNPGTTDALYTVKLVVSNSGGCKDSTTRSITIYPQVKAQFTVPGTPSSCSPSNFTFVNLSNTVATKFVWDFGDGATTLVRDTVHTFSNNTLVPVTYKVKLVAISANECKDSTTATYTINPYIEANFAVDTAAGCDPLTVNITNGSIGPYTAESWTFDPGVLATTKTTRFQRTFNNTNRDNDQNHNIVLTIKYGATTCQSSKSIPVKVYANIYPKVSVNTNIACNLTEIKFSDSTRYNVRSPYSYRWDFGDGGSALGLYDQSRTIQIISTGHAYENTDYIHKTYKATFSSYTQKGCHKDTSILLTVFPQVKARFSFNNPDSCSPYKAVFKDVPSVTARWYRFWDDWTNPSAGYPVNTLPGSVLYLNNDTVDKYYYPKLKVAYMYNNQPVCFDSLINTVTVHPQVNADFTADTFKICFPGTIHFQNLTTLGGYSLSSTNPKLTYKWLFGDNATVNDYSPSHGYKNYDYVNSQVYTATLTAESADHCLGTKSRKVTIYPKPYANFDIASTDSCPPFPVKIDHYSEAEPGSVFSWNFNDGQTRTTNRATDTLIHTYNNGVAGSKDYDINLLVTTPYNCKDSLTQTITVWPKVVADFAKDTAGCNPFFMQFTNQSVQANTYIWDFGNQTTSRSKTPPAQTFLNESVNDTTFTVKLTAFSKYNCRHDTTHKVTVYPQPRANFEADRTWFTYSPTNNIVTFTNKTQDGNYSYSWDFGDGHTNNTYGPILQNDYQPHWDGRYNVHMKVWTNHCTDSMSRWITVNAPVPISDFAVSENGCVPLTVTFTEMTDYGLNWKWDFADGGTYEGKNPPPYTFYKAGKYHVKLTVTGNGGTSTSYRDVEVYPKPVVDFDLKPDLVMISDKMEAPVQFYNKCQLAEKFLWDFGDSTRSTEEKPLHIYKNIGLYTVKLGAWTVNQCYDEKIKKDTVDVVANHELKFPNAFTPTDDGSTTDGTYKDNENFVFHPMNVGVVDYHLEIYDRWGEKLFESNDIKKGWNGYYKGKLCKTDVYIWKVKGKYTDGTTFEKAGNVTLLR